MNSSFWLYHFSRHFLPQNTQNISFTNVLNYSFPQYSTINGIHFKKKTIMIELLCRGFLSKMGVLLMKNKIFFVILFLFFSVVLFGEVGEVVLIQPEQDNSAIIIVDTETNSDAYCNSDYSESRRFSPEPFNSENDLTKAVYDANSFMLGINSDLLIQQNLMTLQSLQKLYKTLESTSTINISDYSAGIESVINGEVNLSMIDNSNLFFGIGFENFVVGGFADLYLDSSMDLPAWPFEVIISGNEIGKHYEPFSSTDTVLDSSLSIGGFFGYKADSFTVNLSIGMYGPVLYSDMHRTFEFESSNTAAATALVSGTIYSGFDPKTIEFQDVQDILKNGGWKIDAGFIYGSDYPLFGVDIKNIAITEAQFSKSGQFDAEALFSFDTSATPPATYSADYTKEIQWVDATGTSYKLRPTIAGYFNIPLSESLWTQIHAQNKPISGFSFGAGITAFVGDNFS
ncbi:MAG TPA: steryl acetyl hydrolase, partial [Flexilinea sp.]|nr:steryl acetyl hydrolase [Flexilinea sp.]